MVETVTLGEMLGMHNQEMRKTALTLAVRTHEREEMESTPKAILETAQQYLNFILSLLETPTSEIPSTTVHFTHLHL